MKVWIFLPAYNERASLVMLLPKLEEMARSFDDDGMSVLLVDDGSNDGTSDVLRQFAGLKSVVLTHKINRGLGETERDGFEYLAEACGADDVIVRLDCDDTHEPKYIAALLDKLKEGFDVVNTSRFQPGGYQVGVNWYRRFISRAANVFMKVVFGLNGIKDYSCGFRAYRAAVIKDAVAIFGNGFLQMKGFGFTSTLEIIVKLNLLGCRFAEVPFGLRYDQKVTDSKMASSVTMLGYLCMATLYHLPKYGWRAWRRRLASAYSQSATEAAKVYSQMRGSKSIASRLGA